MNGWPDWGAYLGMALAYLLQYRNARAWRAIANSYRASAQKWEQAAERGMATFEQIVAHAALEDEGD